MQWGVRDVPECSKQVRAVRKWTVLQLDIKGVQFDLQWSDNLSAGQFINKQRMRVIVSKQVLPTEQHMHSMPWFMFAMHISWQLFSMHKLISDLARRNVLLVMSGVGAVPLQQCNMSSVRYWRVPDLPE
jgi:hypothetical protein